MSRSRRWREREREEVGRWVREREREKMGYIKRREVGGRTGRQATKVNN